MNTSLYEDMYNSIDVLSVKGLDFKAIGKIVFSTGEKTWNIPHLHYIINKARDGVYEAVCIELREFASGNTIAEVVENMGLHLLNYLNSNIKKSDDIDQLINCVDTNDMDEYWKEYRKIDFTLAKSKKDINSVLQDDIRNSIEEKYKQQYEEQYQDLIKQLNNILNVQPKLNIKYITIETEEKIEEKIA